ncbi:Putative NAD(P)-binding domain superfamily [Colletotrichum destructivum]|uniref:NAD(P)-binding domain superfamily n=1 Tax=Colletotrichum destructivum TaxID=34406 RepID=A0AAX4I195_9PEZI|nr:Putative NAD(P)-binding domain superfamily [Colletotrichum destructivum]
MAQTVLVVGATGNVSIAAILGALRAGLNVLAVVCNQELAKKIKEHGVVDKEFMTQNFESNYSAYRATIPYLLEQKDTPCTWTTCTGSQGDKGDRALPAISQGAMFSMAYLAIKGLADTNVCFNEIYLAQRVEVDVVAEEHGTMKSSIFGRVYANILAKTDLKGCRVRVESESDVDNLRAQKHEA